MAAPKSSMNLLIVRWQCTCNSCFSARASPLTVVAMAAACASASLASALALLAYRSASASNAVLDDAPAPMLDGLR
jgi:hypothetical protein